jgi:hypothetical protein
MGADFGFEAPEPRTTAFGAATPWPMYPRDRTQNLVSQLKGHSQTFVARRLVP